ncbi:MAG: hypothetical protein QM703_02600 [Gemmatales bacterium]
MIEIVNFIGLALLLATLPVYLAQRFGATRLGLAGWSLAMSAVFLIPWNGHSIVYFVRGVVGDLSVSSLVVLCVIYGRALTKPVSSHQHIRGQVGWMLLAILLPLYASTTGYLTFDLYGWGYEPQWFLVALGLLMLWAWQTQPALAIAWLIGVVSFAWGMTPSRNLWDALFDPFMAFTAMGIVVSSVMRAVLPKKSATPTVKEPVLRQAA